MNKTFESELPNGYVLDKVVDAKSGSFTIIINVVAFLIIILTVALTALIVKPNIAELISVENPREDVIKLSVLAIKLIVLALSSIVYIVLHELLHGIAYKSLTKQKLTFGMTLTVAYCGVPNIFVYRKTALIALLTPFVVFLPIFLALTIFLPNPIDQVFASVLLGYHIGGCCGDLYDTILFLFKYKDPTVLMKDTGPIQEFYVLK